MKPATVVVVLVNTETDTYHGLRELARHAIAVSNCGERMVNWKLTRRIQGLTQCKRCGAPVVEEEE